MKSQSLNGIWQYRVGKGAWGEMKVPYSRSPVGHSELLREFDLACDDEQIELLFEGITYHAKVTLNDTFLGEMLAYSEYRFDVTEIVRPAGNRLFVELEDIDTAFGSTEGWENFGGIIRGVSLEYHNRARITDVFFHCKLQNDYRDARMTVELSTSGTEEGDRLQVVLLRGEENVLSYSQAPGAQNRSHLVRDVSLWSPESPALYTLKVFLRRGKTVLDGYECEVGFREFAAERHRFLLNGKPTFLKGVCRHEMIGDSGHCPTVEQIEEDLRMIKRTGMNYVRLVHYPHRKETLAIADRLGLMVSEEPGLWWSDTADPEISAGSIEVLRRTILRDRNHASIIFWLCFNECRFTEQFLVDSAKMCKQTDPTRLVSGANCMSIDDTLKYYKLCGFDFYTMHPYAQTFSSRPADSAKRLVDKPLVFTEWGGHYLYDNHKLLREFIREMIKLWRKNSDEGALAGASFWYWAEVNDFNRHKPDCYDGVLTEALVSADRVPRPIYETYRDTWTELDRVENPADDGWYEPAEPESTGTPFTCASPVADRSKLLASAHLPGPLKLSLQRKRSLKIGPLLCRVPGEGISQIPFAVRNGDELTFTGSATGKTIRLIGAVTLAKGYPILGDYGEAVAELRVCFRGGGEALFPLRNGVETTTVFTTLSSSRIEPIAEHAVPHAHFGYDRNYENYLLNRLDLALDGEKQIERVTVTSAENGYELLIYGVFVL